MQQNLNDLLEIAPSKQAPLAESLEDQPPAIGGWLILPAIGLVLSITLAAIGLFVALSLADRVPSRYEGIFAFTLFVETAFTIFIIYVDTRFFGRKQNAPTMVITMLAAGVLIYLSLMMIAHASDAEIFASQSMKILVRNGIAAAIWIPYFRLSERVKRTFIVP